MPLNAIYHTPKPYNNLTMKKYFIFIRGMKNLFNGGESIDSSIDHLAAAATVDRRLLMVTCHPIRYRHSRYDCTE